MRLLRQWARDSRGQSAVELAGVIPVVLMMMMLILQLFLAMTAVSDVRDAARDGARARAAGQSAHAAALDSLPGWIEGRHVSACGKGCVRVDGRIPLGIPGVITVTRVPVHAEAVFRPGKD